MGKPAFILIIIIFSGFFCLFNNYDVSYDYILHPSDYTKAEGTIISTYSRGRPGKYKHYTDIEYEWKEEVCKLQKAKRGLFDKTGKETTLYIKTSSGSAIRGITLNYMDIAYFIISAVFLYKWGLQKKHLYIKN